MQEFELDARLRTAPEGFKREEIDEDSPKHLDVLS